MRFLSLYEWFRFLLWYYQIPLQRYNIFSRYARKKREKMKNASQIHPLKLKS